MVRGILVLEYLYGHSHWVPEWQCLLWLELGIGLWRVDCRFQYSFCTCNYWGQLIWYSKGGPWSFMNWLRRGGSLSCMNILLECAIPRKAAPFLRPDGALFFTWSVLKELESKLQGRAWEQDLCGCSWGRHIHSKETVSNCVKQMIPPNMLWSQMVHSSYALVMDLCY